MASQAIAGAPVRGAHPARRDGEGRQKRRAEHAAAQYLPRRTILGIVRHSANLHSAAEPARTTDAANAATATGKNAVLNTRSHDTYLPRRTM